MFGKRKQFGGAFGRQKWRAALAVFWLATGALTLLFGKAFVFWIVGRQAYGAAAPAHLARRLLSDEVRPIFEAVLFPATGWLVWLAGCLAICLSLYQAFIVRIAEAEREGMMKAARSEVEEERREDRNEKTMAVTMAERAQAQAERTQREAQRELEAARRLRKEVEAEIEREARRIAGVEIERREVERLAEEAQREAYLVDARLDVEVRDGIIEDLKNRLKLDARWTDEQADEFVASRMS